MRVRVFRWLWGLGLLAALLACDGGSGRACGPDTCAGCCDAAGVCQGGSTGEACGGEGLACGACAAPQACVQGRCAAPDLDGGATGGGAGGGGASGGGSGGGSAGGPGGGGGGTTGSVEVSGVVTYDFVPVRFDPTTNLGSMAFAQTQRRPVRNATVRVVQGTAVLASGLTAENGAYALRFTPSGGAALQVQVLARSATPVIQVEDNTDGDLTWAFGAAAPAAGGTVDLHATSGWTGAGYDPARRKAAPFAILDTMLTAARAFMAVRPAVFPPLKVNWSPRNTTQDGDVAQGLIGTTHYWQTDGEIYVVGKAGADTDEFDTHVIVHEWGHFFEHAIARSDSPGGSHQDGQKLDPRLSFAEGWGNAVAAMVLPETVYADSTWSGTTLRAWGFDAETAPSPTDDPAPSAFSEASALRALFDLYDTAQDGPWDQVALGLGGVYDILTGPHRSTDAFVTLATFVTAAKARPGVSAPAIDTLLAHYQVGPLSTDWGDGDAELRAMYRVVPSLPWSGTMQLLGGYPWNTWQQTQYYVVPGTGGPVTVSATATQDVALEAFHRGALLGEADDGLTGTERLTFATTAGATYVVVLTGYGDQSGQYAITLSFTSP